MQRNNVIVFLVLGMLIIIGWYWMVHIYHAPTPTDKDKIAQKDPAQKDHKPEIVKPKQKDPDPIKEKPKEKDPEKKEVKPPEKVPPAQTIMLGGDGFHLTVAVTARGAGLRKVVLNRFEAANWRGEPTQRDMELIPDDEFSPSFRMYHFLGHDEKTPPVLGLGEQIWTIQKSPTVKDKDDKVLHEEIRCWTTIPGLEHIKVTKIYRLGPKDYHVAMTLEFEDTRDDANLPSTKFRYQLTGGQGLPIEGEWYTSTFRNGIMAVLDHRKSVWRKLEDSIRISSRKGGDRFPEGSGSFLQYAGVANQYFAVMLVVDEKQPLPADGGSEPEKILAWARPTLETREVRGILREIGKDTIKLLDRDHDGVVMTYRLLPRTKQHIEDLELTVDQKVVLSFYETPETAPEGKIRVATWVRLGETLKPQFDDITVRVNSEALDLAPKHKKIVHQFLLYHGPVKTALLGQFSGDKEVPAEVVDRYTHTYNLRTLTDYHSDNWFGKVSSWIMLTDLIIQFTRLMHWLLHLLQSVFGPGLSIVVLTIMVRGVMFPISRKQALFSIKMQELAPELKKITERYPDDPQARMQATQEFYRKHGVNPLASCWPLFLQMPIFLGLYFALQESIHFRLADFLWIRSLAAPDMLFSWGEHIPIISSPDAATGFLGFLYLGPYLNILPLFAVVFMMVQQMQTMPPPTDEQQATQQKMLKFMTIFFGIMFYKVAAGLCIYFIASSLWGMAERLLLPKKKPEVATAAGAAPSGASVSTAAGPGAKGSYTQKIKPKKEKEKEKEAITTIDKLKAIWRDILKSAEKK
jgi:YidC/Oxa1 family membrane protein insertase